MQIKPALIPAFLGILLISYAALGTQPEQAPFLDMVSKSDTIVTGVWASSNSRWDSQTRLILTDSVFKVDSYLKGQGNNTVSVTTLGGILRDRNLMMTFPGMIEFVPGERVLLFLTTSPEGIYQVYGRVSGVKQIQQVQSMIQIGNLK